MQSDQFLRLPLAPVLAVQALAVRRRALILPEPPGPRAGRAGSGPRLRLLIIGDSSAAGVGADSQAAALAGRLAGLLARRFDLIWRLEARTGWTTRDALAALAALPAERFDLAVLALGVNDVTHAVPLRLWLARQTALHDRLRDRFGVGRIIASGLPPMGQFPLLPNPLRWVLGRQAARFDRALAGLAATTPDLSHLPLDLPHDARFVAADGFHPSPDAYREWARMLAAAIG